MKLAILIFALGLTIGMLINELLLYLKKSSGVLQIDHSDPNKDLYKFCIDDLDILDKKKVVIIKIEHINTRD